MKRESMGLVGAGGVTRSFLARMPAALASLGPVKAPSFREARRIANALRAGYAVSDYASLESCPVIWVAVPEATLERTIRDLAARTPLDGAVVVLCDSGRDSRWPRLLWSKGARVASFDVVPQSGDRTFVAEGDPRALSELRRLAARDDRKLIEIKPAVKALYFSGVNFATHLLLPWIAGSVESLRAAGFSRAEATTVAHALALRTLGAYAKAGRKARSPGATREMRRALEEQLTAIRTADPRLAALYAEGAELTFAFFKSG